MSLYDVSVPVFLHSLQNLKAILQKGQAHAEARRFDPANLLTSRLFADMLPLSRQVQIAGDAAKGAVARLAGLEPPKFEDNETTFPQFIARVERTIDYLKGFKPEQFEGAATRSITLKTPKGDLTFIGMAFLRHWAIPNFFFHVTTAYNLLRHNGVEVGKADFLGSIPS